MMSGQRAWERLEKMFNSVHWLGHFLITQLSVRIVQLLRYMDYEQAKTHGLVEPLVILKQNNSKPLALVDAEHFFYLVQKVNDLKHQVDVLLLVKGKT